MEVGNQNAEIKNLLFDHESTNYFQFLNINC
jgi:hypothetical protein